MRVAPLVLLALALIAGSAGYLTHRLLAPAPVSVAPVVAPAPAAAATAPESPLGWTFAGLDGAPVRLDAWPGEVVVLNFWATWCPPCLREIPAFIDLQARYGGDGLQFIGIALDEAAAVAPFVAEKGVNYPVVVGNEGVVRLMATLGNDIGGLPYTAVLRHGEVVYTHQGEWAPEAAAETLAEFLKNP